MRRLHQTWRSRRVLGLVGLLLMAPLFGWSGPAEAGGGTLVVDSAADPGDGDCATNGCTLREAIAAANADPDLDTITFNIPGAAVQSIDLAGSQLTITAPVTIDGYTQSDAAPNSAAVGTNALLRVEIFGDGSNSIRCLEINANATTIRGLVLNRCVHGINITDASNVTIAGNYLGTDPTGTTAFGNFFGVAIESANNTIGGASLADRNPISGNVGSGVSIQSDAAGNQIINNIIGYAADGASPLGNGGDGIEVDFGGRGNRFLDNSIGANSDLGIDLAPSGVNPNDPKDRDTGSNRLQNFPVLTLAETAGGETTIKGTLNSTPNTKFTIQVFATPPADGADEGKVLLGQKSVTTNDKGKASFTIKSEAPVNIGDNVTATATNKKKDDTSEFAAPLAVVAA